MYTKIITVSITALQRDGRLRSRTGAQVVWMQCNNDRFAAVGSESRRVAEITDDGKICRELVGTTAVNCRIVDIAV